MCVPIEHPFPSTNPARGGTAPVAKVLPHGPAALLRPSVLARRRGEPAPVEVALNPELGLAQRLNTHEVERDEIELAPRLELRPRRRVALDLREGVEGAPLGPGARPSLAHGLGEPAPAVGDDHLGRRDRPTTPSCSRTWPCTRRPPSRRCSI